MRTSVCITGSTAIRRASSFSRKPRRQTRGRLRSLLNTKRSEEHTSELQSRSDLVCRLLLEKKKKKVCLPGQPMMNLCGLDLDAPLNSRLLVWRQRQRQDLPLDDFAPVTREVKPLAHRPACS